MATCSVRRVDWPANMAFPWLGICVVAVDRSVSHSFCRVVLDGF